MVDRFKAGSKSDALKILVELIHEAHPHLSLIQDQIVIMFREDVKVPLGKVSKVSPKLSEWTEQAFTYLVEIELPAPLWNTWDENTRRAVMDHWMCAIAVKEDEESDKISVKIREPEICYYADEMSRYGEYLPVDDGAWLAFEKIVESKNNMRASMPPPVVKGPKLPPPKKGASPKKGTETAEDDSESSN